jgi:phosphate transport system permease protein
MDGRKGLIHGVLRFGPAIIPRWPARCVLAHGPGPFHHPPNQTLIERLVVAASTLTVADMQGDPRRRNKERRMQLLFRLATLTSVLISALILFTLARGAIDFLRLVPFGDLIDGSKAPGWYPRRERFDLPTVLLGSVIMGSIAMIVAIPFGLGTAIFLSEFASPRVRKVLKPVIEVLAGLPSVVVGYFALRFIAPEFVGPIFNPDKTQNMMAAGLGIGILIIPIMASVSEDALSAVPQSLREASYGVGARKSSTVVRVVLPAAVSGIVAAIIIAISRAIGETMVATMAGGLDGQGARATNPLDPGLSITAALTNAAGGTDQVKSGAAFQVLFFLGLVLFVMTMTLNLIGDRFVRRVRQKY